ncbi:alginate biosynthesis protein Alg44 [Pseudomonas aeruginosa]|nr:alginate biosynthesis protein Alg44 [Pseudomonas aeruginosa]
MNTAVNVNVVHESEAQRQFARVKLPARIRYIGANREGVDARLLDLSAGGFAFTASGAPIQPGDLYKGKLLFQVDSISFSLEVEFQVRSVDPASRRVGCEFQNLKPREVAALRYLITSYLAGEVIGVGDMLNTLQRENFTKARKQGGGNGGMGFFGRVRAVTLSTAIFVVGVGAFAFILNQMYNLYFVTHADSGVVSVPNQQITMPREGTVQSLLGPNAEVAKGAPIATFSANLLDMLKGNLTEEQLNPGNIEKLFGHQMKGTLTSPCDCRVVQQLVADGQYANKGPGDLHPRAARQRGQHRGTLPLPQRRRAGAGHPGELPGRRRRRQPQRPHRQHRAGGRRPVLGNPRADPARPAARRPVRRPPGRGQHRRPARPHPAEQGRDPGHRSLTGTRP